MLSVSIIVVLTILCEQEGEIVKTRQYICHTCDKVFDSSSRQEFERHQFDHELKATKPTGINYMCFHCDASFDFPNQLVTHFNESHTF